MPENPAPPRSFENLRVSMSAGPMAQPGRSVPGMRCNAHLPRLCPSSSAVVGLELRTGVVETELCRLRPEGLDRLDLGLNVGRNAAGVLVEEKPPAGCSGGGGGGGGYMASAGGAVSCQDARAHGRWPIVKSTVAKLSRQTGGRLRAALTGAPRQQLSRQHPLVRDRDLVCDR